MRAAGSKVGRLPRALRDGVNQRLAEAVPAAEIAAWLNAEGRPEIVEANVENWRQSGYLDYLDRVERLNQIRLRSEASVEMVQAIARQGKVPITEANDILLASVIHEALESFDPAMLRDALEENPRRFFNLAAAVGGQAAERCRREKLELELEKFRDAVAERRRKLEETLRAAARGGGLSPETLARLQAEMKLL